MAIASGQKLGTKRSIGELARYVKKNRKDISLLKGDTYTKSEVDAKIAELSGMELLVVAELPSENIRTDVIYLVPDTDGETGNLYREYVYISANSAFELIGSATIDLSGYVTETSLEETLTDYATTEAVSGLRTEVENITDELRTEVDYAINTGVKNLLPNLAHYYNQAGVDFIENPDGSITANGTATADTDYFFTRRANKDYVLDAGTYIVSGANRISKNKVFDDESEFEQIEIAADGTFTLTEKSQLQVTIRINNGETVDNVTYYPMIRRADISDGSYAPYAQTNSVLTETKAEKSDVTGLSKTVAKNLLPNNATSKTQNGITFTVNDDGSVTINGTSTADASLPILEAFEQTTLYKGESYILSKGVNDKANVGIFINCYSNRAFKRTIAQISGTNGTETKAFTLDYADYDGIRIAISIGTGVTLENYTVYPMLRYAEIKDDTFVPYSMTARELTTALSTKADAETVDNLTAKAVTWDAQNVLGAKNVLPNVAKSFTLNGITFIVNGDKTVTINGTATAESRLYLASESNAGTPQTNPIPAGDYILTGVPSDAPNGVIIGINFATSNDGSYQYTKEHGNTASGGNTKNPVDVTVKDEYLYYRPLIRVENGVTVDNVTLSPMLRLSTVKNAEYTPFAYTNWQLSEITKTVGKQEEVNTIFNVYGSKNLLPQIPHTHTTSGITYTKNDDGSITANGTATAESRYYFVREEDDFNPFALYGDDKEFILSDGIETHDGLKWTIHTAYYKDYAYVSGSAVSTSNGGSVSVTNIDKEFDSLAFYIQIASGTTVENLTFYPMLRLATVEDDAYVPFAYTNRTLSEKVDAVEEEVAETTAYAVNSGVKNLLPTNWVSTGGSVTFVTNSDGSVTVNGVNALAITFYTQTTKLPAGKYILSGCPQNGSGESYMMDLYDAETKTKKIAQSMGTEAVFTLDDETEIYARIRINSGYQANNLIFYPMLRDARISDSAYTPYLRTNRQLTSDIIELSEMEKRNILPAAEWAVRATRNGVTMSVKEDAIILNGTATENAMFLIASEAQINALIEKGHEYVLSYGNDVESVSDVKAYIIRKNSDETRRDINAKNKGQRFVVAENETITGLYILVTGGATVDNFPVYLMLRDGKFLDNTYIPYAMTERELTLKVENLATMHVSNVNFFDIIHDDETYPKGKRYTSYAGYITNGQDTFDTLLGNIGEYARVIIEKTETAGFILQVTTGAGFASTSGNLTATSFSLFIMKNTGNTAISISEVTS